MYPSLIQKLLEHFPSLKGNPGTDRVGGGSINEAYRVEFSGHLFFCKVNSATKFPQLFEKEKRGLELIRDRYIIKTPAVIDCWEAEGRQFLLLEWVREGARTKEFWQQFGTQLAALHQTKNPFFGLDEDNYMGSVPQSNGPESDWCTFFIHRRLRPLVTRCREKKLLRPGHERLFDRFYLLLPRLFGSGQRPVLLHGDLWSGNFMCNERSEPVLIDPAVYYGHPSADMGMTTLFGGFHSVFYESYQCHMTLPPNHREQWAACNLYPLLIHLLLFGQAYLSQIERTLDQLHS